MKIGLGLGIGRHRHRAGGTPPVLLDDVTVTPLFNRVAVQVNPTIGWPENTTCDGYVDVLYAGGVRYGTQLLKRYDADEYYGNIFNLPDGAAVKVRVSVRMRSTITGKTVATQSKTFLTTTLSTATPQATPGGSLWYVDPVDGNNANDGQAPTDEGGGVGPKKWLSARVWQPGDTIVIVNGNFDGGVTTERWIGNNAGTVQGAADNWIRVVPYSSIDPVNGDPEKETFKITLALNGPWTETSEGSGVWYMSTDKLVGVVRDETTGWQLYHHNHFNSGGSASHPPILTGFDPADFPQLGGAEVQGWFIDTALDRLYIRTHDGNEPEADRYVAGYAPGLTIRNASYVSVEDFTFELCQSVTSGGTGLSSANVGLDISSATTTTAKQCHHIYVKRCTFKDSIATITSNSTPASCKASNILYDDCEWERLGVKEYFIDRVAYTQADPYDSDLGYSAVKAAFWARAAVQAQGVENLTIRNPTVYGYDLHQDSNSATFGGSPFFGGKNLDIHGGSCVASVVGVTELGHSQGVTGLYINAAIWNLQIDDSAEPVAISPSNSGPIWVFCLYGDRVLHTPFKIGIQSGVYGAADGNSYKIIANNSFTMAGHCTSETLGNMRFQGVFSGLLADNNVVKGYESTESSPLGNWFSYAEDNDQAFAADADRINLWNNGLVYIRSVVSPLTPRTPKIRWNAATYDILAAAEPPADEIVWSNYDFFWTGGTDIDPFPSGVAGGMNPLVTRKSVYVRGITDLAGDGAGNAVALADLPIGRFPLRDP